MTVEAAETIVQAKRNAARARARVDTDVAALQQRLHPKALAQDAIENVREKTDQLTDSAVGVAKRRPAITAAAGGAVALIVLRKPLKGLYRLVTRRRRTKADGTDEDSSSVRTEGNGSAPESGSAPPDNLIPHAAVPTAATTAKQE